MTEVNMKSEDPMKRIIKVRKFRELTQKDMANLFNITKSAWSSKERGTIAGFSFLDIQKILNFLDVDANWVFGQIDCSIEEALLDYDMALEYGNDEKSKLLYRLMKLEEGFATLKKDVKQSNIKIFSEGDE